MLGGPIQAPIKRVKCSFCTSRICYSRRKEQKEKEEGEQHDEERTKRERALFSPSFPLVPGY